MIDNMKDSMNVEHRNSDEHLDTMHGDMMQS